MAPKIASVSFIEHHVYEPSASNETIHLQTLSSSVASEELQGVRHPAGHVQSSTHTPARGHADSTAQPG